jgi:hypothetical protein
MPPINVNVSGSYTHYAPAERCVVSIRVSKEGKSQSNVVEAVSKLSNDISQLLGSLCPKDPNDKSKGVDITNAAIPVTHWSMSSLSTSSWIPYVHVSDKNPNPKQPDRIYRALTNFRVKFKDFKKMGELCMDLTVSICACGIVALKSADTCTATDVMHSPRLTSSHLQWFVVIMHHWQKNDEISISNFDWRLTDVTQSQLRKTVRQGAVKDAIQKATDYASVFSATPFTTWTGVAKEITVDANGSDSGVYGRPKMMMAMRSGGGGGEDGDTLNFEPEDVSLSATVSCKFEMVPST